MQLFKNPNFNFLRWRWPAAILSSLIIAVGVFSVLQRGGIPLGIDFSGGTIVIVRFDQPVSVEQVRAAVTTAFPGESVIQPYGDAADREMLIRLPQIRREEEGTSLGEDAQQILAALQKGGLPSFEIISTEIVGPVIGADLQRRGIYATLAAIGAITIYIAFRFRPSFALGSVVATFHDVLVTLSMLVLFNYELSLNIVAAMLTMVGYSVNDMIVIFDRVRENARSRRREPMDVMINTSLNQTLTRTVITSGTIFLSVLALYLFGGEVLEGFAFTMVAGTIATTYSGWFIAPSIAILLSKGSGTTAVAAAPRGAAEAKTAEVRAAAAPSKRSRRARG
jgi:preprotein translocase subunit SecF